VIKELEESKMRDEYYSGDIVQMDDVRRMDFTGLLSDEDVEEVKLVCTTTEGVKARKITAKINNNYNTLTPVANKVEKRMSKANRGTCIFEKQRERERPHSEYKNKLSLKNNITSTTKNLIKISPQAENLMTNLQTEDREIRKKMLKPRPKSSYKKSDLEIKLNDASLSTEASIFRGRIEDYAIGKEIGKGAYAIVKQAYHKPTNKKMAIKIYEKVKLLDPQRKNSVKREIQILKKIEHDNIVKLYEVIDNQKQVKINFLIQLDTFSYGLSYRCFIA
jgi:hypothetical protein